MLELHPVKVFPSKVPLAKEDQLAWKMASVASDRVPVDADVQDMVINRFIDNAAVAIAAINRQPVSQARAQAIAHPREHGATVFGMPMTQRFDAEWAAWANGTAVRELDMHDTFLAADYSHPGDNIPPILSVAQQVGDRYSLSGKELIEAFATAYELHINLVKAICLHKHKKDHIAHLCPATAAGIGTLLNLSTDQIYQSIQQAVHVSFTTRQSRKGEISSWKAFAPAHSGKLAIEAVDRCMRGEKAPSPIYEGEDSVIAYMLDGPSGQYRVPLPPRGESKRAIMESYTKEHSAEYQAQALIDLAFKLRPQIKDFDAIDSVTLHTSHHTHYVIGTGAGDPQKMDPKASRETLDHSIMYIFAVALQDGAWHHVQSYSPERASRADTVRLWHKIKTVEDAQWTARYHDENPEQKAFGARVEIRFKDGSSLVDELALANAHAHGARPFKRENYVRKFKILTEDILEAKESDRFLMVVQDLAKLPASRFSELTVQLPPGKLSHSERDLKGIF